MVLSIAALLFVGIIAYVHFVQGFFSATISAVAAVLAAVLAVGYCEPLARLLFRGTAADSINSICLCMIFIVAYIAIRVTFDKLIPGNVRIPATIDYIGAALMGIVAGCFCTGILAIAIEMLPMDPSGSFFGDQRYALLPTRDVIVNTTNAHSIDSTVSNQMVASTFDPAAVTPAMWLPVDALVMGTAAHLSDGGALAGRQPLTSIHPAWLDELFAQRVGTQTAARHVALVTPKNPDAISVVGVWRAASLPAFDGYGKPDFSAGHAAVHQIRPEGYTNPFGKSKDGTGTVTSAADRTILIVRLKVASNATDDADHLFRFGPGALRLVDRPPTSPDADAFGPATNYYPVGFLDDAATLLTTRADDFHFLDLNEGDGRFDAVFLVPAGLIVAGPKRGGPGAVAPGTFLQVKRMAWLDLAGQPVTDGTPKDPANLMVTDVLKAELHPPVAK